MLLDNRQSATNFIILNEGYILKKIIILWKVCTLHLISLTLVAMATMLALLMTMSHKLPKLRDQKCRKIIIDLNSNCVTKMSLLQQAELSFIHDYNDPHL